MKPGTPVWHKLLPGVGGILVSKIFGWGKVAVVTHTPYTYPTSGSKDRVHIAFRSAVSYHWYPLTLLSEISGPLDLTFENKNVLDNIPRDTNLIGSSPKEPTNE